MPRVAITMPVFRGERNIRRALVSVLRQQDVDLKVFVGLHGSDDRTGEIVRAIATTDDRVAVIEVPRAFTDRHTPARPLNILLTHAIDENHGRSPTWVVRLDADDALASDTVLAEQLERGNYKNVITSTGILYNPDERTAYLAGPHPRHRTLATLRGIHLYCVAHPSTAVNVELLRDLIDCSGPLVDEKVDYGEDLGMTCKIVRAISAEDFSFVDAPYCLKELSGESATSALSIRKIARSHLRLMRLNQEITPRAAARGIAELAMTNLIGERRARILLARSLGFCGWLGNVDFGEVEARLAQLAP